MFRKIFGISLVVLGLVFMFIGGGDIQLGFGITFIALGVNFITS